MFKQKSSNIQQQLRKDLNPFTKQNPYRLKAKFHSQNKTSSLSSVTASSNPESLLYKRNYQQTPGFLQYSGMRQNRWSLRNKDYRKLNSCKLNNYKLNNYLVPHQASSNAEFKQYISDKLCPSDVYLQIVKDKFSQITDGSKSQFQNVIRMSNLAISRFSTKKSSEWSNQGMKQNPFLRKNLLSSNTQHQPLTSSLLYSNYNSIGMYQDRYIQLTASQYRYQDFSQYKDCQDYQNNQYQSMESNGIEGKVTVQDRKSYKNTGRHSIGMECSFGHAAGQEIRNGFKISLVEAIIQNQVEDPLRIQENAKQQIIVNGKKFYFNKVKRLPIPN